MQTDRYILSNLVDFIQRSGTIFGAVYKKKDGTITKVNGRFGVHKHLKGGHRTVPSSMYVIWDNNRKRYTALDPERIISLTYQGQTYGFANSEL
jgi:hypothetical protein